MDDAELLRRYATDGSQEAFAQLVRRYADLVYSAARRQTTKTAMAEDVTQAVFLVLARKASTLGQPSRLAGWLLKVTYYAAQKAVRAEGRRQYHEQRAATMRSELAQSAGEPVGETYAPQVDAAMAKLGEAERSAVALRYLRGMSLREVGEVMGLSEEAARKRVHRALARLHGLLGKQAAIPAVAGLGTALATRAVEAAPAGLADSVVVMAAGGSGGVGWAGAIAKAAMKRMAWAKVKVALTLLAVGIALAAATASLLQNRHRAAAPSTPPVAAASATTPTAAPATRAATQPATPTTPADEQKAATDAANAFLKALRDRNASELAALIAADSPEQRLATANQYIADLRDRDYARFPQRLIGIIGRMFTTSHEGQMLSARFEINSPIDADTRQLSLALAPSEGKWLITAATMPLANSIQQAAPLVAPPATRPAAPGTYAKANEILMALYATMGKADPQQKPNKETAAKLIETAMAQMEQLTATLKGTDLEWPDEVMVRARPAMQMTKKIVLEQGMEALQVEAQKPDSPLKDAEKAFERIFPLQSQLAIRIEAEEAATGKGSRPVSCGAPMELTLGWNTEKVTVPGPPEIPTWFKEGAAYKAWQFRHDVQSFTTTDDVGNRYEISFLGASREADGALHDMISGINVFRPNGTLLSTSSFYGQDKPTSWGVMDKSGTRYLWKLTVYAGAIQGYLEVCFFDEDGSQRIWTADRQHRVWLEQSADPIGQNNVTMNEARPPAK